MKLVEFELNGHQIAFYCEARDTRNGFAHDAKFFIDSEYVTTGTCHYLNRTWEYWHFQSACLACCSKMIAYREDSLKRNFKDARGLSRVAGKNKEELLRIVDSDDFIALLKEIKKVLNERAF